MPSVFREEGESRLDPGQRRRWWGEVSCAGPAIGAVILSKLVIGKTCAFRRTRTGLCRKVKLVEKTGKREQIKIFLDEPHRGLEEWTKARWLIVPWGKLMAFANDEEREIRARQASAKEGDGASGRRGLD